MKKIDLSKITKDIILLDTTPSIVNLTIKTLSLLGIKVHEDTTEFDPDYPHLWFCSSQKYVSQRSDADYCITDSSILIYTAEDFIDYLTGEKSIFKPIDLGNLNDENEYRVTIINDKGDIKVGCQIIKFDTLEKIYGACITVR